MNTQWLVLQPSKSSALGKSIKQPKQNPEVLMSEIRPAEALVRQFTTCYLPCSEEHQNHHKQLEHHPQ